MRVQLELERQGHRINRKRVQRLMRTLGIQAHAKRNHAEGTTGARGKSFKMALRYAHLSLDHLKAAAKRLDGTKLAQPDGGSDHDHA